MAQPHKSFLEWLGEHLFSCPFKSHFGIDCPGCGLQRSILALFRGDLTTSFKFYPATIPLIFLVIFTIIHLKLDFKYGAQLIKIVFAGVAVIILINYIYKIYTHQLI
ncbi:DUF2752 domain-containing protein [Pedobacter sp. KLB.chiD]|uniref:DUF2752 domain-containing protein n=1 Tax=Pedobacter sp. KLB.chiD TaxID=3387402 RepID=UPI00399B7178